MALASEETGSNEYPALELPPNIRLLDTESTDDAIGMKMVFSGTRADGKVATFETGSFFDQTFDVDSDSDEPDRHDICVSTAGGCTRQCRFCSVPEAELGFERLLTSEEIVFQVMYSIAQRNPSAKIPNIVGLMGNGEPPDNLAVIPAVEELANNSDANIGRITISTIGENTRNIGKMAAAFAKLDTQTILQFSLHAANEEKRRRIIPGKVPFAKALEAADNYAEITGEPVKYNVVLMEGTGEFDGFTNAQVEDAKKLSELLHAPSLTSGGELQRLLKLSAYNPIPGKGFVAPSKDQIQAFVDVLKQEGITDIQWFLGSGIDIDSDQGLGGFACGQLRATTANLVGPTAIALSKKPRRFEKTTNHVENTEDLEQKESDWRSMRLIFVVGAHAVGKSTITEAVLTDGYSVFDAGPILEEQFEADPIGGSFESWIARSEAEHGKAFVSVLVGRHIREKLASGLVDHPEGIVVIGPRKVSVVENLVDEIEPSDSRIVLIEAPTETLFERYNQREGGGISQELFEAKLAYDRELGLDELKTRADVVIKNDHLDDVTKPSRQLVEYLAAWTSR